MIKKADVILTLALIVIGLVMSWFFSFGQTAGSELVITRAGKVFGTYSLAENRTIEVKQDSHINKITIKNGKVSMSFSDCHGQDCVQQHAISQTGENIVCLPNKVMLEIKGDKEAYDSVAR